MHSRLIYKYLLICVFSWVPSYLLQVDSHHEYQPPLLVQGTPAADFLLHSNFLSQGTKLIVFGQLLNMIYATNFNGKLTVAVKLKQKATNQWVEAPRTFIRDNVKDKHSFVGPEAEKCLWNEQKWFNNLICRTWSRKLSDAFQASTLLVVIFYYIKWVQQKNPWKSEMKLKKKANITSICQT